MFPAERSTGPKGLEAGPVHHGLCPLGTLIKKSEQQTDPREDRTETTHEPSAPGDGGPGMRGGSESDDMGETEARAGAKTSGI